MSKNNSIIHGDVGLHATTIPSSARKLNLEKTQKGLILERGEHTGHAHVLTPTLGGYVEAYLDGDLTYISVKEAPTVIIHEEHAPLVIPVGDWVKKIENEYDPFSKVIKKVVD